MIRGSHVPAQLPAEPSAERVAALAPGTVYRRLTMAGFTPREAGTLCARLAGLPMVTGGWSIAEVERLRFVLVLVRDGRLGS